MFCVAIILAPVALCAAPTTANGTAHLPLIHSSDAPSAPANAQASQRQGSHTDDPVCGPVCDTQTPDPVSTIPYSAGVAVDMLAPGMRPGTGTRSTNTSSSDTSVALADGVRRTVSARSAALESDKASLSQGLTTVSGAAQPLGLKVRALSDDERTTYGVTDGLIVTSVGLGTAQQAGFRQGDVVLMLDGISLTSAAQFYKLTRQLPHDRPVPVLVHRPSSNLFLPLGSTRR